MHYNKEKQRKIGVEAYFSTIRKTTLLRIINYFPDTLSDIVLMSGSYKYVTVPGVIVY